jgi:predicted TIM-barrel fold metal-dependent hydrolase
MHQVGVRGLRVNLGPDVPSETIITAIKKNAVVAKSHGWALQLWIPISTYQKLHSIIPTLGVTVVADHFARAEVGSKTNITANTIDPYKSPGFPEVIDLVRRRLLFVKISAPYQNSKQAPLYEDMRVVAESLINAGPDMVVYGSDWPHTSSKEGNAAAGGRLVPQEYRNINDAALVEIVKGWCGNDAQIRRMFVDNPRRLWQWYTED